MDRNPWALALFMAVWVSLFGGSPDLADGLIHYLSAGELLPAEEPSTPGGTSIITWIIMGLGGVAMMFAGWLIGKGNKSK